MITNEDQQRRLDEAAPEADDLWASSTAPTLRDLCVAAKDLPASGAAEPGATSPNLGIGSS